MQPTRSGAGKCPSCNCIIASMAPHATAMPHPTAHTLDVVFASSPLPSQVFQRHLLDHLRCILIASSLHLIASSLHLITSSMHLGCICSSLLSNYEKEIVQFPDYIAKRVGMLPVKTKSKSECFYFVFVAKAFFISTIFMRKKSNFRFACNITLMFF